MAHAFVFWGFCVFSLVTLNHLLWDLVFRFFRAAVSGGVVIFFIAGVFAVAVAISIAGLAFRRFVIRPKWLEPLSPESGLIAFLIFALMVTYLATFWVAEGNCRGLGLWWAHTVVLLVFLPLIPSTKHMHLVLSPLTIFLERDGFSQIPPLVGDEDFGLVAGKDLTQIAALQAYSCVECGRCTEHCPANNNGQDFESQGNYSGHAALSERIWAEERASRCWENIFRPKRRFRVHYVRGLRISVSGRASSICR